MKIIETPLKGLYVIEPKVFKDERGYFYESYNQKMFQNAGITDIFVQDNQSLSQKNVVRGLHFQSPPYAQAKLVRVIKGAVLDVVVDIRKNSQTYGKHYAIELTEENFLMLYVPVGFAHGFATLEDNTIFAYKCSNFYNKESEDTILWNDPDLNINWNVQNPVLSEKDKNGKLFCDFISPF
ncbi:MAG TPA: dTDP-4-dehydrorhamnose 3,5-epimerase [Bacteroidia bacterium]|nr:dTDP-4-dehydrorhamnose 3,5-epimerase [Bacteroidia bacterium]